MGATQSNQNKTIDHGIYVYYYGLPADQQIKWINSLSKLDLAIINCNFIKIYELLDNPTVDVNYKSPDGLTCFTRFARHIFPWCERHDIFEKFLLRGGDLTEFLMFKNTVSIVSKRIFTYGSVLTIVNVLDNKYYREMTTFSDIKTAIFGLLNRRDYDDNNELKFRGFCHLFMLLRLKATISKQLLSSQVFEIAHNKKKTRTVEYIVNSEPEINFYSL